MKLQFFPLYIREYLFDFPAALLHEISHWIFAIIPWYIGLITFPKIHIKKFMSVVKVENGYSILSNHMCISFSSYETPNSKLDIFITGYIAISPLFLTILLFYYSPWWMYLVYLNVLSTLLPSTSDREQISEAIKIFKK